MRAESRLTLLALATAARTRTSLSLVNISRSLLLPQAVPVKHRHLNVAGRDFCDTRPAHPGLQQGITLPIYLDFLPSMGATPKFNRVLCATLSLVWHECARFT